MNTKETLPTLVTAAPVIAAGGAPILIGVALLGALFWFFSDEKKEAAPKKLESQQKPSAPVIPSVTTQSKAAPQTQPIARAKRVCREDLAEALEYGERAVTRQEAVNALQNLGFKKTAAYKALSPSGRFGELLEYTPDGLIEWKG
jgi:hypothetical protein